MKWTRTKGADGRWEYTSGPYRIARAMYGGDWELFVSPKKQRASRWRCLLNAKRGAEQDCNFKQAYPGGAVR